MALAFTRHLITVAASAVPSTRARRQMEAGSQVVEVSSEGR